MHCVLKPSQWTGRSRCYTLTNLNESPSKCKTRNCENVTAPSSVSLIQWSWRCSQNSLQRILWIFCVCVSKKSVHLHLSSNTLLIKVRSALYLWILMPFSKASKKKSVYTHGMGSFLIFFFHRRNHYQIIFRLSLQKTLTSLLSVPLSDKSPWRRWQSTNEK